MNTYNENLQQTVVNTLSDLALNQSNLDSLKTVAEYTLYYAQGAELTARDKLEGTKEDITTWQNINNQSLINANQVFNLLASATDANADVAVSISNTATAAANVQIASNAISVLASDIGAAFNIATASLYKTDVYEKIHSANSLINEVANESKSISKSAMNASGFTSEITISEVLAQTTGVKAKIDNLFKSTQAQLDKFSKLAITENTQITNASKAERQAEGGLSDARTEKTAIDRAYDNANNQLNQYLIINVVSGFEINASFAALPLPTFYSPQASLVTIPPANPNYYLTLIPTQNQTMFSIDQVEQLFAQRPVGDNSQFFAITPDVTINLDDSVDASNRVAKVPTTIPLTKDAFGNKIQAGTSYVAFLYIELSKQYKQYISNFADLLSAPSQPFTPATTLPLAQTLLVTPGSTPDADGVIWSTAQFQSTSIARSADMSAAAVAANAFSTATAAFTAAVNGFDKAVAAAATATAASVEAERVAAAANQALENANTSKALAASAYQNAQDAANADPNPDTNAALSTAKNALDNADKEAEVNSTAAAQAKTAADDAKGAAANAAAAVAAAKQAVSERQKDVAAATNADADAAIQLEADASAATPSASVSSVSTLYAAAAIQAAKFEYRCILVEESGTPDLHLLSCPENQNAPPIYFNRAIAEQVSPANYLVAQTAASGSGYTILFPPTTTDNFGNMVKPNTLYKPYILTVAGGDSSDQAQFTNVLANTFSPITVCTQSQSQL